MPLSRHGRDGRARYIKGLEIVKSGALVQLVRTPASHAGDHRFGSRYSLQCNSRSFIGIWQLRNG